MIIEKSRISDQPPAIVGDVQKTDKTYRTLVNCAEPGFGETAVAVFGLAASGRNYFLPGDRGIDLMKVFPKVNGPDGFPIK